MDASLSTQTNASSFNELNFSIDADLALALTSLAQEEGNSLYPLFLTAYQLLLGRHCNTAKVEVGGGQHLTTISSSIEGNASFREAMKKRQAALRDSSAMDNSARTDVRPKPQLLQGLRGPQAAATPYFTASFAMTDETISTDHPDWPYLTPRLGPPSAVSDLELRLTHSKTGEIKGQVVFREDVFELAPISRFVARFQSFLTTIASNPDDATDTLPIMSPEETNTVLYEWNETDAPWPQKQCIHQLFETQAKIRPSQTALIHGDRDITYLQLFEDVKHLATILAAQRVEADVPVALLLERSVESVVAIYGVLQAGGFYVPVEAEWPTDRIESVLDDANPPILITCSEHKSKIPQSYSGVVLLMDDLPSLPTASRPTHRPASPSSAVYCLYTSGTAGKPKGIVVEHQGLVKRIQWLQDQYPLSQDDRVLNKTPYSFGISEWEYFWALPHGATLVIASPQGHKDPEYLHQLIVTEQITVSFFVPSMLTLLLNYMNLKARNLITAMTYMFTCGEALLPDTCSKFFSGFDARLINLYGPSEADMTYWECPQLRAGQSIGKVPIGKPIANVKVYILDKHTQPVPIGISGELHFGGANTARGYLNLPHLTKEKYISNPFSAGRIFKTGDIAQWLPDGNIEFLGRADNQVNIRGFRIELSEIEITLSQHPNIQEAFVLVINDERDEKRLIAYLLFNQAQVLSIEELHAFLRQKLPQYMVPSLFVPLDEIPLTPNGKVDRKALSALENTHLKPEDSHVPARSNLERQLTLVWERILNIHPIGIRDDFFELGGHSLMAVELFDHIEKTLGQNFPLATLFQARTIEQLAHILDHKDGEPSWSSLVPIQPNGSKPPLFCIHAIGGNILSLYDLARHLGPDQPCYGLQSQGLDGKRVPPANIEDTAAHYLEEIRTLQPEGPYFLCGQSAGGVIAFEIAQQLNAQGQKVALLSLIDSFRPGHFEQLKDSISFSDKITYYLNEIYKSGPNPLFTQIKQGARDRQRKLKRKIIRTVNKFYLGAERPLPHKYRYTFVQDNIKRSINNYAAQPFTGPMVLFRPSNYIVGYIDNDRDPDRGWAGVAAGGLEIFEIPGNHNLEQEPSVGMLAEKLTKCLTQAQGSDRVVAQD